MTNCRPGLAEEYPALIGPTRDLLTAWGGPWIIENVDGADVASQDNLLGASGLLLCGFMFGLELYRHRLFEANFALPALHHPRHSVPASRAGHWKPGTIMSVSGHCAPITKAREAMGIDWLPRDYLREAVPPAYTEYIGLQLNAALEAKDAA
jgi:DNA (cytosine-5)-methyltransferase 1